MTRAQEYQYNAANTFRSLSGTHLGLITAIEKQNMGKKPKFTHATGEILFFFLIFHIIRNMQRKQLRYVLLFCHSLIYSTLRKQAQAKSDDKIKIATCAFI